VLLVVVAAAVTGLYLVWQETKPSFVLRNRLVEPVQVRMNYGGVVAFIEPGDSLSVSTSYFRPLRLDWSIVAPVTPEGHPMGEVLEGEISIAHPWGPALDDARPQRGSLMFFAPIITNESNQWLQVTVNSGRSDSVSCACRVGPGAQRVHVGYYTLDDKSTVQLTDILGRSVTFTGMLTAPYDEDHAVEVRVSANQFPPIPDTSAVPPPSVPPVMPNARRSR
jgi:hypothetical protein